MSTASCTGARKQSADWAAEWLSLFGPLFQLRVDAGSVVLERKQTFAEFRTAVQKITNALADHWGQATEIAGLLSRSIVGTDPADPNATALLLTLAEKNQLLAQIERACTRGLDCERAASAKTMSAAGAIHLLFRTMLSRPWRLDGIAMEGEKKES